MRLGLIGLVVFFGALGMGVAGLLFSAIIWGIWLTAWSIGRVFYERKKDVLYRR
jgi:hypothetical protein